MCSTWGLTNNDVPFKITITGIFVQTAVNRGEKTEIEISRLHNSKLFYKKGSVFYTVSYRPNHIRWMDQKSEKKYKSYIWYCKIISASQQKKQKLDMWFYMYVESRKNWAIRKYIFQKENRHELPIVLTMNLQMIMLRGN